MSRWFPESVVMHLRAPAAASAGAMSSSDDAQSALTPAVVADLRRRLAEKPLAPGARVTCVLSDSLVRFRIVPWDARLSTPKSVALLAKDCFRQTYGDVANAWRIAVDAPRYGRAALSCAVDGDLMPALKAELDGRGLRLTRMLPALAHAYNRECRGMADREFWFIARDAVGSTLLLVRQGAPHHLKSVAGHAESLARLLDREWFALGLDGARCEVHVVDIDESAPPLPPELLAGSAWRLRGADRGKSHTPVAGGAFA